MKSLFIASVLALAASCFSTQAFGAALSYMARCNLSEPAVSVTLDNDPASLVTCRMQDGSAYFKLQKDVHMRVGSQSYTLTGEWNLGLYRGCHSAMAAFSRFEHIPFIDDVTGLRLTVVLENNSIQIFNLSGATSKVSCIGTRTS